MDHHSEPMFNVPAVVLVALGLMLGVHLAREVLSPEAEEWLVIAMALIPARVTGFADQIPGGEVATVTAFVTHMLVHGDWTHLIFNGAWLLAFGGVIARRYGSRGFVFLALGCGIAGAAAFLALNWGRAVPVVGASGAVAGLMGATFRFLFNVHGPEGLYRLRTMPETVPLMTLSQALGDRRLLAGVAIFLGINLLAMVGFGSPGGSGGIAWEAHIGGFLAGFLLVGRLEPPAGAAGHAV